MKIILIHSANPVVVMALGIWEPSVNLYLFTATPRSQINKRNLAMEFLPEPRYNERKKKQTLSVPYTIE